MELEIVKEPNFESNCYILEEDGACVVVDPNDAKRVPEAVLRRGWKVELIILTHEHCDHMAGLDALRDCFPEARVVISEVCAAGLQDKRINMSRMAETYLAFAGKPGIAYQPFVTRPVEPAFSEEKEVVWRGHRFYLRSMPGHSPGSTGIWMDEKTFFSGDYLLPEEDKPVLRLPGGSEEAFLLQTLPVLLTLPKGVRIYPGHGASGREIQ